MTTEQFLILSLKVKLKTVKIKKGKKVKTLFFFSYKCLPAIKTESGVRVGVEHLHFSFGIFCILRNFAKFTGKHLCQSLFDNKVACLSSAILLKKRLWHRCFPVNFAKFLRIPFLQNTSRRLLLYIFP